jgi:predicted transcriptional regulator
LNIELLKSKIAESGMTKTAIAERTNMTRATLYNRLLGKGDFTVSEVDKLSKALHLMKADRDRIFFD